MLRTLVVLGLIVANCGLSRSAAAQTPTKDQLPGTQPLALTEPLDVVMVRGINRFAERELAASRERRAAKWQRDYSSVEAYLKSIEPHRQRLKEMIGAGIGAGEVDYAVNKGSIDPNELGDFSSDTQFVVSPYRWSAGEGRIGEGWVLHSMRWNRHLKLLETPAKRLVVVIPDSTQTPEDVCGFNAKATPASALARRLAQTGCSVLVVTPISRSYELSGHPDIRFTNLPHRELVYRCGFELGLHPIGYETTSAIQARRVLADSILPLYEGNQLSDYRFAIAGIGDGGMVAAYAAALDPAFDAVYMAGYFDERESIWRQPIDRNVFGLLTEFGDADLAGMIAPRPLVVDNASPPTWDGPAAPREGRLPYAAPGKITPPDPATVQAEFERAKVHYDKLRRGDRIQLIPRQPDSTEPISEAGLAAFLKALGINEVAPPGKPVENPPDFTEYDAARQKRLVESLVRHTQMVLHRSDKAREKFWKDADRSSPEKWAETSQKYRDYVHDHMIGRLPLPTAPLNPRTRKVIDEPTHAGWEVVVDVYGESPESRVQSREPADGAAALDSGHSALDSSVIAGGILLLPKDLQPGEQRPVVVCQHGLEGTPLDTITLDESTNAWRAYKGFSTQLVKRGFIVYAPQNPYKGEDEFRVIQRKSNPLGRTLFSYIIEQHRQTLAWLATLPYVDPERIAFYGLSYGGKTAVRVPPLLDGRWSMVDGQWTDTTLEPSSSVHRPATKYCLSICSADFNEWIRKNCSAEDRYSYVYTKEYEMFEWNMGHVAGYAELSSLMAPRPFMVERGHDDGVAPDEWVGWEYAKVRRHYDKLGLGDKTEIEWFNGPHTINGQGTFRFLHKHLNWPEPATAK